jgi:exopolysaccharide biosynthesis polyprenyl glycosylphosphotransferase
VPVDNLMSDGPRLVEHVQSLSAVRNPTGSGARARRLLRACDLLMVAVAMLVAGVAADAVSPTNLVSRERQFVVLVLSLPCWAAILSAHRLYSSPHVAHRIEEVRRIASAALSGGLAMVVLAFLNGWPLSRGWTFVTVMNAVLLLTIEREAARRVFAWRRRRGTGRRDVVVVGVGGGVDALAARLERSGSGYAVVDTVRLDGTLPPNATERLLRSLERSHARGVVISGSGTDVAVCNRLARLLTEMGIHVELSVPLDDIASNRLSIRLVESMPMVYVAPVPRRGWRSVAKRVFDVSLASVALVLTLPLLAVAAVAIKVNSRGPVLFRQVRVGRDGNHFRVFKLRTMVEDAESQLIDLRDQNDADGPMFKMRRDPRVTRVGRVLRTTSVDELPQLWNVLRGEMSLVGPRPAIPAELTGWDDRLIERLRVRPGITGMWQVHGRSNTSFADYSRLDLYYVDNWSLLVDLAIVARTVPAVLLRRGAA